MRVAAAASSAITLFIIFVALKLTGVIGWSGWWVASPLWIAVGIDCILLLTYKKAQVRFA